MIFRIINLILALFVFGFIYQKAVTQSFYNWDAIAYTMAVQLDEGKTTEEAHEYTYKTLESEVEPGLFNALCCSGQYRQDQYSSPDNLKSMMPMYALKPGYILLIRAVKGLTGISEYQSMKYISLVSSLILAFIFFIAFFWQKGLLQFLWIPLVFFSQILFLGKLMTPDAVTTVVFIGSIYFLLRKSLYISFLLMGLALTFRPDMIVAAGLLGLLPALDKNYRMAIINSVLFLSIYFLISTSIDHNGWWSHFYTSLVSTQSNLDTFNPVFDLNKYKEILLGNLNWLLNDMNYITWFATTFIILIASSYLLSEQKNSWINIISVVLALSIFVKFLIFPKVDARVYLAILVPAIYVFSFNLFSPKERIDST